MDKILIVEDEAIISFTIKNQLVKLGYTDIDIVFSGKSALELIAKVEPKIVLMDIAMESYTDGFDTALSINKTNPNVKIIFISSYPENLFKENLKIINYSAYIEKTKLEFQLKKGINSALS